jgi:hypothetical protein
VTTLLIAMLGFLGGVLTVGAALIAVAAGAKKDLDELERRDYAAQKWKRAIRAAIPNADTKSPAEVLAFVEEAIRQHSAKVIEAMADPASRN